MKILKELRQKYKYTQAYLAEQLGVTQQAVAQWESGKAKPSLPNIRDLAVLFGTSMDSLLDGKSSLEDIKTNHYNYSRDGSGTGFWGHLGLGLASANKTKWYPITLNDANQIADCTSNEYQTFISVNTLNNRSLYINKDQIKHIYLLDDNADQIDGDWELGWDSYQGYSADVYPAISEQILMGHLDPESYSEGFIAMIKDIIEEFDIGDEEVFEYIERSYIWTIDRLFKHCLSEESLSNIFFLDYSMNNLLLDLGDGNSGYSLFLPTKNIVLIDVPTHQMRAFDRGFD